MSRDTLRFQTLAIMRTPGILPPGFRLSDLDGSINIVYGPNGIGKSTSADAIQSVLWPDKAKESSDISAIVAIGADTFEIETISKRAVIRGSGNSLPHYSSTEMGQKYYLAFQDLIKSHDTDFARLILREVAGGYDVASAYAELGYKPRPANRRIEFAAADASKRQLDEAEKAQAELLAEEATLNVLEQKLLAARQEYAQLALRKDAREYRQLRDIEIEAVHNFRKFPAMLRRITGGEGDTIQASLDTENIRKNDLQQAWRDRRSARARKRSQLLPATGISDVDQSELTALARSLKVLEDKVANESLELGRFEAAVKSARAHISGDLTEQHAALIDDSVVRRFAQYLQSFLQLEGERLQLDEIRRVWGGSAQPQQLDDLKKAESILADWIVSPKPEDTAGNQQPPLSAPLLIAVIFGVIATIVPAVFGHPAWLILLVGFVAAVILSLLQSRTKRVVVDLRSSLQQQFKSVHTSAPEEWSDDFVKARIDELREELHRELAEEQKFRQWDSYAGRFDDYENKHNKYKEEYSNFLLKNGLGESAIFDAAPNLYLFCSSVCDWARADSDCCAARAAHDIAIEQKDAKLSTLNQKLTALNLDTVSSSEEAGAAADVLQQRRTNWAAACGEITRLSASAIHLTSEIRLERKKRIDVYNKLGIDIGDYASIKNAVKEHEAFIQAYNAVTSAKGATRNPRRKLRASQSGLLALTETEITELIAAAEKSGNEADALNEKISIINARVAAAKTGTAIADKLADWQDKLDDLAAARENEYGPVVGHVLSEFIRKQSEEQDRPAVFRKADELFRLITKGSFKLDFDSGEPPAFRAIETETGARRSLDQLSSGTRVQLLLAVRLAFIESQEGDLRLPLIIDEALANSDDERAPAIIEALFTISEQGRQIFYLTAQQNEVDKWRELLKQRRGLSYKLIDMSEVRGKAITEHRLRTILPSFSTPTIPPPGSATMSEYAHTLNAPAYDPLSSIGSVDICDLTDDVSAVYALRCQGIHSWGQLDSLGPRFAERYIDEDERNRMSAKIAALMVIGNAWKQGRPPRIHFDELKASGAISDTFDEQFRELLESVNGNAEAILNCLSEGGVRRFQKKLIDVLREYMNEGGWTSDLPVLTESQILDAAINATKSHISDGALSVLDIERLVALIPQQNSNKNTLENK